MVLENVGAVRLSQPLQQRSRKTLAAIVAATEELLKERGLADIAIAEIVALAGCTTGSFYARFPSKDALLPYLYEKYDEDVTSRLEAIAADETWGDQPLAVALAQLVETMVESYAERIHLMREITLFARRSPEALSPELRRRRGRLQAAISAKLLRFPEMRHPNPGTAIGFAFFAAGAVAREMVLFSHAPLAQGSALDRDMLVREVTRLILAYLTHA